MKASKNGFTPLENAMKASDFRERNSLTGFTLAELLLAALIFSTVCISIYSAYSAGIAGWRRLNSAASVYQQAGVALDLMADEIANYIPSRKVLLEGAKERLSFLGKAGPPGEPALYRVSYYYQDGSIIRSQQDLKRVLYPAGAEKAAEESAAEQMCLGVENLEFGYYCPKPDKPDEYEWVDALDQSGKLAPLAVRFQVKFTPLEKARKASDFRERNSLTGFTKVVWLNAQN